MVNFLVQCSYLIPSFNSPFTHTQDLVLIHLYFDKAKGVRHVFSLCLLYQKGKDNTVADFLSRMENHLPKEEVEEALRRVEILAPGVKAMLDNADTPITERAEGMMCSP